MCSSTRPGTGWDHVRLSWRRFYIGKYYAVTFYKYKVPRPDRDPGAALFLDVSRLVFSRMSTQYTGFSNAISGSSPDRVRIEVSLSSPTRRKQQLLIILISSACIDWLPLQFIRLSNSYCRPVFTGFSGRLPGYRVSWETAQKRSSGRSLELIPRSLSHYHNVFLIW